MKEKNGLLCKEWERRRRDRLNEAFKALAQLLPHYDPAKLQPKIDILEDSTQFVKELRLSNSRLLNSQTQSAEMASKIRELQDEVNKLILRVKQLTKLLLEAKIPIPPGPSVKLLILGKRRRLKQISQVVEHAEDLENAHRVKNLTGIPLESDSKNKACLAEDGNAALITRVDDEPMSNKGENSQYPKTKIIVLESGYCPDAKASSGTGTGPLRETNNASADPTCPAAVKPNPTPAAPVPVPAVTILPTSTPVISLPNNYIPTLPTIFLTQCPSQPQPLVFTLGRPQERPQMQPRILPKFTLVNQALFQMSKVPILPIRKPAPPKPKFTRRRRRQKDVKISLTSTTSQTQTQSQPPNYVDVNDEAVENSETEIECVTLSPVASISVHIPEEAGNDENRDENNCENMEANLPIPPVPVIHIVEDEVVEPASLPEQEVVSRAATIPEEIAAKTTRTESGIPTRLEEVSHPNITVESTDQQLTEPPIDNSELPTATESVAVQEPEVCVQGVPDMANTILKLQIPEPEVLQSTTEPATELSEAVETSQIETHLMPVTQQVEATPESPQDFPETSSQVSKESTRSILDETCLSSDKISECIARSIDLIEHPENELMELSEDWGTHSPKSPISPTQMFLSMFPLLPRESFVTVAAETQLQHKNSSRSSFYIDSMLPDPDDQNAQSTSIQNLEPENHFRTLTSVSSSSSSTCLAMTPLTPVFTCTKNANRNESSLDSFNKVLAPLQNYKEKRTNNITSEAVMYVSLNEPSSSRSGNKTSSMTTSAKKPKSSPTKKFLTVLEPPTTSNEFQHPNFFPYTPIPNIDSPAQTNSISQFFNSFTGSSNAQYIQSPPVQSPCSAVPASTRQTDFDFSFRQTQYSYQSPEIRLNPQPQHQQCDTAQIRQNPGSKLSTSFLEPNSVSHKPPGNATNKSQSELFRPAPNVFLVNNMNTNTHTGSVSAKQQHSKAPRETQEYSRATNTQRVYQTKTSTQPTPPVSNSTNTAECARHHQQYTASTSTSYSQDPPYQAPVPASIAQKQVPSLQPHSQGHVPISIPPPSQVPVFSGTTVTAHKQPATGSTIDFVVDTMYGPSRPSVPPPIPAPDFSYSNQNYHTGDTNYFHDPNTRPFYQAYPNAPVTVTNTNPKPTARAPPYYLPEPSPVPVPVSYETFNAPQSCSISQPQPTTVNAQVQGQNQGHFPQNSNFFPPFYNNPVHIPPKESPTHQNQAYNPPPAPPKTITQEYFQYPNPIGNTRSDAANTLNSQQHQHHRHAPAVSTTTPKPSPKKTQSTPTMNYGPQSQQPPPAMKRSNSAAGHQSQPQAPQQRPVNWMTDNSTYKKGTTVVSNPFSVSKLVGSGSQSHSGSNYCAEALIRKNNSNWNDFQFGSNSNTNSDNSSQSQSQFQGTQPFPPESTQQPGVGHYSATSFPHQHQQHQAHHRYNPYSQNFNQFNTSQHQQLNSSNIGHQPQVASSSSTVNVHNQGTTTSISNFNLSSIFPEINDKGSKSASGSNNCNYYVNRK